MKLTNENQVGRLLLGTPLRLARMPPIIGPCLSAQGVGPATLINSPSLSPISRLATLRMRQKPRPKIQQLLCSVALEAKREGALAPKSLAKNDAAKYREWLLWRDGERKMTAEIAIINRSAVTLAADSAMTLEVRGREKIYTSADKIFELSLHDPIGIMINNNLEYLGIPLDIAIKKFRTSDACTGFNTLEEAVTAFIGYLETTLLPDEKLQERHARTLLGPVFQSIRTRFLRSMQMFYERLNERQLKKIDIHKVFLNGVNRSLRRYEALPVAECFAEMTVDQLQQACAAPLQAEIDAAFRNFPLNDSDKTLLCKVGATALHRKHFSEFSTGIVFAGFGKTEDFPSLIAYETDGVIAGKLKKEETHRFVTGRSDITADIIPFAQREMVDRFLFGIDPEFENGVEEFLSEILIWSLEEIAALDVQTAPASRGPYKKRQASPEISN
jgi:hypothetical protein